MKIDKEALTIVLGNMPDGFVFEEFAQKILSIIFGDAFIPVGGSGDRGVDGFKYVFSRKKYSKLIYQISTEEVHWKQEDSKITDTQDKLNANKIEVDKLHFVTNRKVERKDTIQDNFYGKYEISLTIYDLDWFITNIISEPRAADVYTSFVETHVHEFHKPGKLVEVGDFSKDPRLYVFLRQHIDEGGSEQIESKVLDGLILYALEGTGSEKKIFKSSKQILDSIRSLTKFSLVDFDKKLNLRLTALSDKQNQKINHHTKEDAYCLPFETRIELAERDIKDAQLQTDFKSECEFQIKENLKIANVQAKNVYEIFEEIIHSIYYRQGLEFSDFILNEANKEVIDDSLRTIVGRVVDDTEVKIENKNKVKTALLVSIREVAYNGSEIQREFLRRLSKTYMLVFLTQNDPKISLFFQSLANKLNVFVGTSIIIPALSEYYLDTENKRYWNLLKGARASGVCLMVNEYIVDELVSHFKGINDQYLGLYKDCEEDYLKDDISILYIDEILIRAYFYAKRRDKVSDFNSFLMKFIQSNLASIREDIIFYLKEEFDINYVTTSSQDVKLDQSEVDSLTSHLKCKKQNSQKRAEVDSKLILHIYKLREKNNETNSAGIFGYKTWWLSQDVNTYKSVKEVFGDKYSVSCYMRADFLYKYISLSPQREDIDVLYRKCFPNLIGVNMSYHIPYGVSEFVSQKIQEHKDTNPKIVRRTLKNLTAQLMTTMDKISTKEFKTFFEEELERIRNEQINK